MNIKFTSIIKLLFAQIVISLSCIGDAQLDLKDYEYALTDEYDLHMRLLGHPPNTRACWSILYKGEKKDILALSIDGEKMKCVDMDSGKIVSIDWNAENITDLKWSGYWYNYKVAEKLAIKYPRQNKKSYHTTQK